MTKAVILCGGQGTRIKEINESIPKPMLPIGKMPILWHIMKIYSKYGINDFVLCLGYKSEIIKEFFLNYRAKANDFTIHFDREMDHIAYLNKDIEENWKVTLIDTGIETMTGARIKKIQSYIQDDDFLLTYGDGVANVDIQKTIEFHKKQQKILTVTGVRPSSRFGEINFDPHNYLVKSFHEKPQVSEGYINGGFFVANKKVFEYLNNDDSLIFENEPMRKLANEQQMVVYPHNDFWQCMDTAREYHLLNSLWSQKKAPWLDQ